jgi:hypothetical protein
MGDNLVDAVGVPVDGEVKAPVVVYAGLPTTISFVKLLGAERGVIEVAHQKVDLLDESFLDGRRCVEQPLKPPSAKGGRSSQRFSLASPGGGLCLFQKSRNLSAGFERAIEGSLPCFIQAGINDSRLNTLKRLVGVRLGPSLCAVENTIDFDEIIADPINSQKRKARKKQARGCLGCGLGGHGAETE